MAEAIEDWTPSSEEIRAEEAGFVQRLTKFWWDNEFSQEKILDRVDRALEKKFPEPRRSMLHALRLQHRNQMPGDLVHPVLEDKFVTLAVFDQDMVTHFILERVAQPARMIAEAANPILYRMITRAAQIPFIDYSETIVPNIDSHASLLRGLSVYTPRKNVLSHGGLVDGYWIVNREWSRVDYFKQLFLGLAYVNSEAVTSCEPDQSIYPGVHGENDSFWVDVSTEAPEVATMLDAISATPPGYRYMYVPRSWYKPIAESMVKNSSSMGLFRVRKTDLLMMVRLALVLPSRVLGAQINLQRYPDNEKLDAMANAIVKDFGSSDAEEIDWPTWVEVISISYPDLFVPLEEFFELLCGEVGQ